MLAKLIISILTALHLLPVNTPKITPATPVPNQITTNQITTNQNQKSGLSVSDEIYADLALQHELGHVSVYYFNDNPKDTVSIDDTKNWDPASTVKLYAAMYAFDQVSHGNLSLDQEITIDDKNVAPTESYQNGYPDLNAGDTVSLFRLIDQMITQSDNTSYNTLVDLLDRREITKYIHDLGLTSSSVGAKLNLDDNQQQYEYSAPGFGPNLITANDYATAFVIINGGRIPGSGDLFNILARQKLNTMIPALLPKALTIAHKTGELDPYYHDGGIVVDPNSNKHYVLSIFSDLGDPSIVAHISNLVYTNDASEVGNNQTNKIVGEMPNAPIDPLVTLGETGETQVLATSTQKIKLPVITAADLGINSRDVSGALNPNQLPHVLIKADSPLHFLIDLGEKIRTNLNPFPTLKTTFETQNLALNLAEANDLIKRNKQNLANTILNNVNANLSLIAKEQPVIGNASLQNSINQVSETRFTILKEEVANATTSVNKTELIKEVASEARNSIQNIKPYVSEGIKTSNLNQTPVIGKVVSTTANSITVKEENGNLITKPLDNQIQTRNSNSTNTTIENATQIPVGSVVAIAGGSSDNTIKPSFILTNVASESANPSLMTILKVNQTTNSIITVPSNGVPEQVDVTKQTIIKGSDTTISLDTLKPGNVIVVHGEEIPAPATSSGSPTAPGTSTVPKTLTSNIPSSLPQPNSTPGQGTINKTTTPTQTSSSSKSTSAPAKTTSSPTKSSPAAPMVIKGDVIKVIEHSENKNHPSTPAPKKENPTSAPNPIPPATPVNKKQ